MTLDGQPVATPVSVTSVVGIVRALASSRRRRPWGHLSFVSWSDGGAATHTIATPATNTTYRAVYSRLLAAPTGLRIVR